MLSAHFDGKQSWDSVDLPSVSQSHYLCLQVTGGEAAPDVLDSCGGTDPLGMFPVFLKRTAEVLAPSFAVVFG